MNIHGEEIDELRLNLRNLESDAYFEESKSPRGVISF
jgi:hypothetical protein